MSASIPSILADNRPDVGAEIHHAEATITASELFNFIGMDVV